MSDLALDSHLLVRPTMLDTFPLYSQQHLYPSSIPSKTRNDMTRSAWMMDGSPGSDRISRRATDYELQSRSQYDPPYGSSMLYPDEIFDTSCAIDRTPPLPDLYLSDDSYSIDWQPSLDYTPSYPPSAFAASSPVASSPASSYAAMRSPPTSRRQYPSPLQSGSASIPRSHQTIRSHDPHHDQQSQQRQSLAAASLSPAQASLTMSDSETRTSMNRNLKNIPPCGQCGKRFTRSYDLHRHMASHSNERKNACRHPGCSKKYKLKQDLKSHERNAHEGGGGGAVVLGHWQGLEDRFSSA